VLSQDLLTVAPERIKDVKVMLTVLAGQNSYRAAGF
jgi:predicted amidohydrolase YtcJ